MRTRRTAITAGTAMAVLALSGCGVGVHFADYRHSVSSDAHISEAVNAIQVSSDDGHVTVTKGSGDGVTVHRVVHYQDGAPRPGQKVQNGTLTFTRGCGRCRVDYDLTVPASVRVSAHSNDGRINVSGVAGADASSDSGSVTVRHVSGNVSMRSDSGSLTAEDIGGSFNASDDSGSIHATALRSATVRASGNSGSVHLDFSAAPMNVRATNDSGSVSLTVPGGPYAITARTDSGGKNLDGVASDPNSARKLFVQSDSGHVSVAPPGGH